VLTDSNQLQQAILNLLVNARDAIDGGGRIQVATSRRSMKNVELPAIEISVKDDGRGMPRDVLANAAEAFFTTKGRRGNGLGLAMVRSFVTDSGGTLDIESEPIVRRACRRSNEVPFECFLRKTIRCSGRCFSKR
jgi:signal transduction histidine kinase